MTFENGTQVFTPNAPFPHVTDNRTEGRLGVEGDGPVSVHSLSCALRSSPSSSVPRLQHGLLRYCSYIWCSVCVPKRGTASKPSIQRPGFRTAMADEVEPPEEGGGEEEVEGEGVVPSDETPKVPSLRYCYSIALLAGEGVKLDDLKVLD